VALPRVRLQQELISDQVEERRGPKCSQACGLITITNNDHPRHQLCGGHGSLASSVAEQDTGRYPGRVLCAAPSLECTQTAADHDHHAGSNDRPRTCLHDRVIRHGGGCSRADDPLWWWKPQERCWLGIHQLCRLKPAHLNAPRSRSSRLPADLHGLWFRHLDSG
jgi:hypothetical protein